MLYIMRHGKTDWNAMKKLQGQTDIPLNEEGREMARKAAGEYKDVNIDICFCSPLARAKETAEILLKGRDIPIIVDRRLSEMCFGKYEGIVDSFKIKDCPVNKLFWDPAHYSPKEDEGESVEELCARTGAFLKEKVEPLLEQRKDVLIVGHGAMNASIVCQVRKLPTEEFWSVGLDQCKLLKLSE